MCGIYASFNKDEFDKLKYFNSSRGVKNESVTELKTDNGTYYVGHIQSPTSNSSNKHPAIQNKLKLWHNGIIKNHYMGSFDYYGWDTMFLLNRISESGTDVLSEIDGSFACIFTVNEDIFIFRNVLAPLFISSDNSLSSMKYEGFKPLRPNTIFQLKDNELIKTKTFETFNNPYDI